MSGVNPAPVALPRRLLAEAIGTGLLVTVVVGSGIAAQRSHRVTPGISATFAGIAPGSVPIDIGAQIIGAAIGLGLGLVLYPTTSDRQPVVVPHPSTVPAIQEN